MNVAGRIALSDSATNDLRVEGRINLGLIPALARDSFRDVLIAGFAENVRINYTGPTSAARLSGEAEVINGSVATFLSSNRLQADRIKARVIFSSDQVQVVDAHGYLGGGEFTATGGGRLDGLSVVAFRFNIDGDNVTVPLPADFVTTGDARLEVTGQRSTRSNMLVVTIGGHDENGADRNRCSLPELLRAPADQSLKVGFRRSRCSAYLLRPRRVAKAFTGSFGLDVCPPKSGR